MSVVRLVDPSDEETLREWYAVEGAAVAERPFALRRPWSALLLSAREPSLRRRVELFVAELDGHVVGVAETGYDLTENQHLVDVEIHVLPRARRRGIGRALHDHVDRRRRELGRSTVFGELHVPRGTPTPAGLAFAASLGFTSVHREDHLVLDLPADRAAPAPLPAHEILCWGDRTPPEHVAAYCLMRNQMNADVPLGDIDWVPPVVDEVRLAESEERTSRSYRRIVAAVVERSSGAMVGYSVLFVPHEGDHVLQDDTLVMPTARGHGLGRQLKLATLAVLSREHPNRTVLHTWTDPDNEPMQRTNRAFGYQPVEVLHEMQRVD